MLRSHLSLSHVTEGFISSVSGVILITLCHTLVLVGYSLFITLIKAMDDDQFKKLIDCIDFSSANLEAKFLSKFSQFQEELKVVAANQDSSSQEVMAKLSIRGLINLKERAMKLSLPKIDAAKKQLELVPTPDEATEATLKQAGSELDQGKEAIRVRQKHIQIAVCSDRSVVMEYEANELASDSDDEKKVVQSSQGIEEEGG